MIISTVQAKKVLTGNYKFSMLGFSMLITRLKGAYSRDSSEENLMKCTNELNSFLTKYSRVMNDDRQAIEKL